MAAIFRSTCRLIFVCHRSVTKIISQQKKKHVPAPDLFLAELAMSLNPVACNRNIQDRPHANRLKRTPFLHFY